MKKLLGIVVLGLLLSGNVNASIIDIGKCISGSLDQLKANYNLEWNEAAYKKQNILYYKFLDVPENTGRTWKVFDAYGAERIKDDHVHEEFKKSKELVDNFSQIPQRITRSNSCHLIK